MLNKVFTIFSMAISGWKSRLSREMRQLSHWGLSRAISLVMLSPMNRDASTGGKIILSLIVIAIGVSLFAEETDGHFDFGRYILGELSTLSVYIQDINYNTGEVNITGGDTRCPSIPFTWDWGDGTIDDGWFPRRHTYSDLTKNYIVKVTAHYSGGKTDSTEITVLFVPPTITPVSLPPNISVSIPDSIVTLTSRMPGYGIPSSLTYFDDSFFNIIPRTTTEYILTVAASIQKDLVNDDVYLINGGFKQVLLRYPSFGGMCSLWYTSPVSFGVGDYGFQGTIQWSSFMHEMGHNFTLNSPADYYYGGKIDGCANAIFSESMAQIFQHATAYEIINNAGTYGLSEDIIADIKQSAISSIKIVRNSYEDYLSSGMNFSSWNNPGTPEDETFNTFMTIAYKFFEYAENTGLEYRIPLKRMMELLQVFNEDLRQKYDQQNNTAEADAFRATLMVTPLSYAFSADLRTEFRDLNFPISDETYEELMGMLTDISELDNQILSNFELKQNYPNPFNPATSIDFSIATGETGILSIYNVKGQILESHSFKEGSHRFIWDGSKYASGIYFYKLELDNHYEVKKMLMVW